jgi:hypothetical protein
MPERARRILIASVVGAVATFCVVQDRVTYAGARRYVAMQRDALAGKGPIVQIDHIMRPVVERSVRQGLLWGGLVLVAGAVVAVAATRRR